MENTVTYQSHLHSHTSIKSRLSQKSHSLVDKSTRSTLPHVKSFLIGSSHSNRSFPSNRKSSKEESHAAERLKQVLLHEPRSTGPSRAHFRSSNNFNHNSKVNIFVRLTRESTVISVGGERCCPRGAAVMRLAGQMA